MTNKKERGGNFDGHPEIRCPELSCIENHHGLCEVIKLDLTRITHRHLNDKKRTTCNAFYGRDN